MTSSALKVYSELEELRKNHAKHDAKLEALEKSSDTTKRELADLKSKNKAGKSLPTAIKN